MEDLGITPNNDSHNVNGWNISCKMKQSKDGQPTAKEDSTQSRGR